MVHLSEMPENLRNAPVNLDQPEYDGRHRTKHG